MGIFDRIESALGFGDTPKPPDAANIIRQEDLLNRYNISTPYGSRIITKGPGGRTQLNINETPFQRSLRQLQENQALGMFQNVPDFQKDRQRVEEAVYNRAFNLISPERERERRAAETSLSLKGLPIGSEAYTSEMGRLSQSQQQQLENLALSSVLAGGEEQSRLQNLRTSRLGELSSVLSGGDYLKTLGTMALQPINVGGIELGTYQAKLDYTKAENERKQKRFDMIADTFTAGMGFGGMGGGAAAGGAAAGGAGATGGGISAIASALPALFALSDKRLKKNIEKIGTSKKGYNIYKFQYNDLARSLYDLDTSKTYQGVIADEINEKIPTAVIKVGDYLIVDYSQIDVEFKEVV